MRLGIDKYFIQKVYIINMFSVVLHLLLKSDQNVKSRNYIFHNVLVCATSSGVKIHLTSEPSIRSVANVLIFEFLI